jgi:hypothetical protein
MEILCPSCQRKLTILEQYAGQQMKCPLCAHVFDAPALPAAPGVPTFQPPAPAPGPAPAPPTFGLQPPAPAPAPPPPGPAGTVPVPGAPPPGAPAPQAPPPPPPPEPVPTEHTGRFSIWVSPRYVQFAPLALLLLVLLLTLFPWDGFYPGGYGVDTQNAWQATFGSASTDKDLEEMSMVNTKRDKDAVDPGFNFLLLLYLLGLLVNLVVLVAAIALEFTGKYIPPNFHKYLRWRWAAVAVVTLLTFSVLLLHDMIGFGLIRRGIDQTETKFKQLKDDLGSNATKEQVKILQVSKSVAQTSLVRTFWYRCAFWSHFWALLFVILTMLADLRSPRPSPRIDVLF